MSVYQLRVWKAIDFDQVKEGLLNIGDSLGDCEKCQELGLDYKTVATCPNCGAIFKYATVRGETSSHKSRFKTLKRLSEIRPDLCFIDYEDYRDSSKRNEVDKFFKD